MNAAALGKFNALHVHAGDSESFALDISNTKYKPRPFSSIHHYTAEQQAEIVRYGFYRGVQVYFGIEFPTHAGAWDASLVANCTTKNKMVNPYNDDVYTFLDEFLAHTVATHKLTKPVVYLGGAQVDVFDCWNEDEAIQSRNKQNNYDNE